jgi:PKD repeat protein
MTGGNTFIPTLIDQLFPGETDPAALQAGIQRAEQTLRAAATLDLTINNSVLTVTVTNQTGHKLPSGYPEGRRIWLNVKTFGTNNSLLQEYGAYDPSTGDLVHDTKIYEIKPGLSQDLVEILNATPAFGNLVEGPSFHFVLNNQIFSDNRIPPLGFTNSAFEEIQSPPVNYIYGEGQNWDNTDFTLPTGTQKVEVTLYYQTTTREYVEFLRDENHTNEWGQVFYDLWNSQGKSAPVVMNSVSMELLPPVAEFSASPTSGNSPLEVTFTDLSSNLPTSWNWDFGDGVTSTEQNPVHTYTAPGIYDVSLSVTNAFGSDQITKAGYIDVTEFTQTIMHVANITVTPTAVGGPHWIAIAAVTIEDQFGNPVADALVEGVFSDPNNRVQSGVTGPDGIAEISSDRTKSPPANWTFQVTDVIKAGAIYDPTGGLENSGIAMANSANNLSGNVEWFQNTPNPFNPTTRFSYYLPEAQRIELTIYNIRGQVVGRLVNGIQSAGLHQVEWNAGDLPSGIYIVRMQTEKRTFVKKVNLIK